MNRPDPATDFVGSIKWLMDKFDRFEKFVAASAPEQRITAAEWQDWMDGKSDREHRQEFDTLGRRELKRRRTAKKALG